MHRYAGERVGEASNRGVEWRKWYEPARIKRIIS